MNMYLSIFPECFPNDTISVTNMDASHYIGAYANNSVGQCNTTFSSDYTILTIEGCGKVRLRAFMKLFLPLTLIQLEQLPWLHGN